MEKLTVLIEARPFCVFDHSAMEKLKGETVEIIDMKGSGIENPDFVTALGTADAVLAGNDLRINDALFDMAPHLKVIAKMGAGLDTVDIDAATRHHAIVFHTPGVNNQAVADHTFALILGVARKIHYCDRSLRENRWEHTRIMGLEIWQKTLGLIGLGAIGQCVALRAKGFQMRVIAHDPFWPESFAVEQDIQKVEIDQLLQTADIVSIHSPLMPETRNLIDARALGLMKPSALLINAARGGIINEADLFEALRKGEIAGAGLDVFETEPPVESPLMELDNVVVTPHTAAFTHDAMNAMSDGVVDQLIEYLKGKQPAHVVNPEVWKHHQNS